MALSLPNPQTPQEIANEILASAAAEPALAAMNNPSAVGMFRLFVQVAAHVVNVLQQLFFTLGKEVDQRIATSNAGLDVWYVEKAYAFQLGDNLVMREGLPVYPVLDPTKQIITRAAITKFNNGNAIMKVAKDYTDPVTLETEPVALTPAELASIRAYIGRWVFPGSRLSVNTFAPDLCQFYAKIYYDPIYLLDADLRLRVYGAIQDRLAEVEFNGILLISSIVDAVQAVEGVKDVLFVNLKARPDNAPSFADFDREYEMQAGYIKLDPSTPLDNTLTFIPVP